MGERTPISQFQSALAIANQRFNTGQTSNAQEAQTIIRAALQEGYNLEDLISNISDDNPNRVHDTLRFDDPAPPEPEVQPTPQS